MSKTLWRYVARTYLQWFVACFFALWAVFLVADFGDRLKAFLDRPLTDVALLYWNKALVAAHQLGPAAMLLAAGAAVTALRRRGEVTAVLALGGSPMSFFGPVAVTAAVLALGWTGFDEWVATQAGRNVDELHVQRFQSWGDYRLFYSPKRWYRVGDSFLFLKGEAQGDVQHQVSLFELGPDFSLAKRIDAKAMSPLGGERWRLDQVTERRFEGEELAHGSQPSLELTLPNTAPDTFRIRTGRPEQMRVGELVEQRALRERVGLPVQRYTLALVEGFFIAVALWSTMVVFKTLALAERMPAPLAAWAPLMVLVGALAALTMLERRSFSARSA